MIKWTEGRNLFRSLLNGSDCVRPASVFDPLSARISEHLGFEIALFDACWTNSLAVSSTRSGAPNYQRSALKFASD